MPHALTFPSISFTLRENLFPIFCLWSHLDISTWLTAWPNEWLRRICRCHVPRRDRSIRSANYVLNRLQFKGWCGIGKGRNTRERNDSWSNLTPPHHPEMRDGVSVVNTMQIAKFRPHVLCFHDLLHSKAKSISFSVIFTYTYSLRSLYLRHMSISEYRSL